MKTSYLLLVVTIVGLTALSAVNSPKKALLKMDDGNYLVKNNYLMSERQKLSSSDAKQLMTIAAGYQETTVVSESATKEVVSKTVVRHQSSDIRAEDRSKIDRIMSKYSPLRTKDENYLILDNYVAKTGSRISTRDAEQLRSMDTKLAQGFQVIDKKLYKDLIDEKVYTDLKKEDPELRSKVDRLLSKYE